MESIEVRRLVAIAASLLATSSCLAFTGAGIPFAPTTFGDGQSMLASGAPLAVVTAYEAHGPGGYAQTVAHGGYWTNPLTGTQRALIRGDSSAAWAVLGETYTEQIDYPLTVRTDLFAGWSDAITLGSGTGSPSVQVTLRVHSHGPFTTGTTSGSATIALESMASGIMIQSFMENGRVEWMYRDGLNGASTCLSNGANPSLPDCDQYLSDLGETFTVTLAVPVGVPFKLSGLAYSYYSGDADAHSYFRSSLQLLMVHQGDSLNTTSGYLYDATAVPEPGTLSLFALGALGLRVKRHLSARNSETADCVV